MKWCNGTSLLTFKTARFIYMETGRRVSEMMVLQEGGLSLGGWSPVKGSAVFHFVSHLSCVENVTLMLGCVLLC